MGDGAVQCSAIIVNYNGGDDLLECLASLRQQVGDPVEIIIVDNASTDGSLERAANDFPEARIVRSPMNEGFAGGCNLGADEARGEVLLFLNPDVVLDQTCVAELCRCLRVRPGVAGPRLFIETSGIWEYGSILDVLGFPVGLRSHVPALYVSGCALATGRRTFCRLGGFDRRYFMIYEDIDYCWRALLAGESISVLPNSKTIHRGGRATPGGYVRQGRRELSTFRIALLERNRLATLLKCAPLTWLVFAVPASIFSILVTALGAIVAGRLQLSKALLEGLAWNLHELPQTLKERREGPSLVPRWAAIRGRIYPSVEVVASIRRHGRPRFVH